MTEPGVQTDPQVLVQRLHPAAPLPRYARPGDAGADLVTTVDVLLGPGERAMVPTGIAIALPAGYAGFVHPRSGLAARAGLGLVNAPGTIDSGYRGEIVLVLVNHDRASSLRLRAGDRVAQLIVQRVASAQFTAVDVLPGSVRGAAGFGSTGGSAALGTQPALGAQPVPSAAPLAPVAAAVDQTGGQPTGEAG